MFLLYLLLSLLFCSRCYSSPLRNVYLYLFTTHARSVLLPASICFLLSKQTTIREPTDRSKFHQEESEHESSLKRSTLQRDELVPKRSRIEIQAQKLNLILQQKHRSPFPQKMHVPAIGNLLEMHCSDWLVSVTAKSSKF